MERARPWILGFAILAAFAVVALLAWAMVNMLSDLHDLGQAAKHARMD